MAETPKRIWIIGTCGSGKSTLADELGARTGIPVTHIDEIHWNPGWVESAPEDDAARIAEVVRNETWVIDGNYSALRQQHCGRAQLFVWLDYPFRITFTRLLRRTFKRAVAGQVVCNGNRESIRQTLFSWENSILWYAIRIHRHRRCSLEREMDGLPCLRFRSPGETAAWLSASCRIQSDCAGSAVASGDKSARRNRR